MFEVNGFNKIYNFSDKIISKLGLSYGIKSIELEKYEITKIDSTWFLSDDYDEIFLYLSYKDKPECRYVARTDSILTQYINFDCYNFILYDNKVNIDCKNILSNVTIENRFEYELQNLHHINDLIDYNIYLNDISNPASYISIDHNKFSTSKLGELLDNLLFELESTK